jgi:hypothetical protein
MPLTQLLESRICVGAREVVIQYPRRLGLVAFKQVSVSIGHVHRRVPHVIADALQAETSVEQKGDERVPALVQANLFERLQPSLFRSRFAASHALFARRRICDGVKGRSAREPKTKSLPSRAVNALCAVK